MTPEFVIGFAKQSIELALTLALPMLAVGLVVGIFVSVIQAATQIQEMTLTFVPKIIAVFLGLLFAAPWMLDQLTTFTVHVFENIPMYIR